MQIRTKRFWALLMAVVMILGLLPSGAFASVNVPFKAAVNDTAVSNITAGTLTWTDWSGTASDVTCYTVPVPQGSEEVAMTFDSEMQVAYYSASGEWLAYVNDDASMPSATTHTVPLRDGNGDGELDGISVQTPNTYATDYYIQFVYAASDTCLRVLDDAPTAGTTTAGALYELELGKVFSDSQGHDVTYSFETTVSNQHTKIADGWFCFSTSTPGSYEVKLTADCGTVTAEHTMTITVEEASEGIAAQYGYDETAKSSVTVYVTLSNDGYPITAVDGTVMANLAVTVPYFDLGLYGLEDYYRYGTTGNKGPYTNDTVVQRPTGLHLYIYLLERYYMGLDESQCCMGTSGVLEYAADADVYYMDGELAYESGGKRALMTSGGATSIYMVNYWGHDENLMYFRNHCYPLMSAGWGSTSDYILLSDGDAWDVGLFSNWSFNRSGKFACFDKNVYNAEPGASVSVSTLSWGTSASAVDFAALTGLTVGLYNSDWELVQELGYTSGNTVTFTAPETAGTYYLLGLDENYKDPVNANVAPAAARVVVGTAGGEEEAAVSRILLNTYEASLVYNQEESKTTQLAATVLPAEATGWTITWTSSDETVATVDENGLVTAVAEGQAVITAAIGDIKAECTITVEKYNSAPTVVSGAANRDKVKVNTLQELDVASMFADAEGDALTFTAEVCKADSLTGSWEYAYTSMDGFDTTIADGKFTVSFPETGIYAVKLTASDGKLSTSHTYQFTVVDNDSGTIALNDGVTIDIWNVVVVDSSEEFVEDYEIQYKGTHDTTIHHIVLSKDTVSGGPSKNVDFTIADGCGWSQYYGAGTQQASWSFRGDIGMFAQDAEGTITAHYLKFYTECETHTDADSDRVCDVCRMGLNHVPTLIDGVENQTVQVQTGFAYQLTDLMNGKIFEDIDGDALTHESYTYRKSSDGGQTWGEWTGFAEMEHGSVNSYLINSIAGTYTYEFRANDGYGYSEDIWVLTLQVTDVASANVNFYVGRDQNYSVHSTYPVLELYKTAGIDENLYDYVGWFVNAQGKTEYIYDPADYTIIDGDTDYVVIGEAKYELHGYEKIVFTNSAFDGSDETATASGTLVGNYNMFYASIVSGRYSTRAYGWNAETSAYDVYLGGQSLELPMEEDIYGGGGEDIYLRVVSGYTTSKKVDGTYFTADDYYVEMIMPVTGSMIHAGDAYVSGNYTYFPFLSYAAGNASLYNVYAYPYDTENYIFNQSINNNTTAGYTVVNKPVSINTAVILTVNVPQTAEFGLYFQFNNFNTKNVEPEASVVNSDGTKTITYKVSKGNSNYTWRLTDTTGTYVTKAGWLASLTAATEKAYTFGSGDATNKTSHDYSQLGTAVKSRDEGDVQVFLAPSGFMSVSDSYRVRAFRMWELINSDTANIMVEPDFNIQVLQGNASDVTLVNGGNAVGNWIDVDPTTTDIIAVNYDAIDMYSSADNYGSHGGLFPATNPERTGVFVITNAPAGTADASIMFNGGYDTDRGSVWDYNYDTWYYLNTNGNPTLDFTVSGTGNVSVSFATVSTNAALKSTLSGWTSISADEKGMFHADLLSFRNAGTLGGTVIIKMTDATGISYRLVRVAEMTATVTNASNPGEPFAPCDDVTITFDGLFRAVNKVAGIFNPTTYYLRYTAGDTEVNGKLAQYQQMDNTTITLTIPETLEFPEGASSMDYTFTDGHIYGSMYAASSPFSTLYEMTDTGVGTNFSAVGVSFVLSHLADITVQVEQKVYYDVKLMVSDGEKTLSGYTLTMTDPDGNVLTADESGIYQDLGYGDYGCDISLAGYRRYNEALHLGSADAADVVDGILTVTIVLEKAAANAWDGVTVTEPAAVDGVYQIGSGAELAWFAQTVNAGSTQIKGVLTADIDLARYNWTPIGTSSAKFAGSFDGKGHKIYNMSIESTTGATYQGLFGNVYGSTSAYASISNLTVEGTISLTHASSVSTAYAGGVVGGGSYISLTNVHSDVDITITRVKGNWARVGGVIGGGSNTDVTDCSNTGTIKGYQYVGGIVGYTSGGTISGCYNAGSVSGYQYVGGIVGSSAGADTVACYNTASVTASNTYAGGIAATSASGKLTNCFNTGAVSASNYAGGVAGNITKAAATVSNVYYLEGTCTAGFGKVTGTHTAEAVTAATLASADFVTTINTGLETAAFNRGKDHPVLTWQGGTEAPEITYGDLNGDGIVNMDDVSLILVYINGGSLTESQIAAADVNGDGSVNMDDAAAVMGYINGTVAKLPAA